VFNKILNNLIISLSFDDFLQETYKEKKKLDVKDPGVLFDFWKILNKSVRIQTSQGYSPARIITI
jgi:hypothetical protein